MTRGASGSCLGRTSVFLGADPREHPCMPLLSVQLAPTLTATCSQSWPQKAHGVGIAGIRIDNIPGNRRNMTPNSTIATMIKTISHATIAPPQPTLCQVLMKYRCRVHPMKGITPTMAISRPVTNVDPISLFSPFTNPRAMPRKTAYMISPMMNTKTMSPTKPPKSSARSSYILASLQAMESEQCSVQ